MYNSSDSELPLVEVRALDSPSSTMTNLLLKSSSLSTVSLEYVSVFARFVYFVRLDLPLQRLEAENKRRRERTEPRNLREQRRPVPESKQCS